MRVLVIGGAGYIGSHVNRFILDSGHSTGVFDNLSSGQRENLFPDSKFIEGDILRYDELKAAMAAGWDAVVHLAAFKAAGESMTKPEKYSVNNISGTINILNAMAETGVRMIVFSSSAAVYGEPAYLPIDEEHPKNPENYYGFTKLEIERILGWYDRLKGIRFAALRYFNACGYDPGGKVTGLERNPANLLPALMETAAGMRPKIQIFGTDYPTPDGTCIRDYIHVSDLASGHLAALDRLAKKNESLTVNLGTGVGVSVREMLEGTRRITGKTIQAEFTSRRPGDPAHLVATAKKAEELLGWKARLSDAETLIDSTWKIYKRHVK